MIKILIKTFSLSSSLLIKFPSDVHIQGNPDFSNLQAGIKCCHIAEVLVYQGAIVHIYIVPDDRFVA